MHRARVVVGRWVSVCAVAAAAAAAAQGETGPVPGDSRVIDATAFGAVPDDGADDTAAIIAALGAPRPAGASAKPVYLPAGVYDVSDTIAFPESRVVLYGDGSGATTIRLAANAPGYGSEKRVVSTRESGGFNANMFRVSVVGLTIEVGAGNPGAVGLRYHNNNQGTVRDVVIRSLDPAGAGLVGLEMNGSDKGPGMIRGVTVEGFDRGVSTVGTEYSFVFEDLTLRDQSEVGIFNIWNILTIRGLESDNAVPVLSHDVGTVNDFRWGMVSILDGVLTGSDPSVAALVNESSLYLRDVASSGYRTLVEQDGVDRGFGSVSGEWWSDRVQSVFRSPAGSLGLAPAGFPVVPWDDPAAAPGDPNGWWASAEAFGAVGSDAAGATEDGAGIQAAIDSGATTVYLPAGLYEVASPVVLRGSVRRVVLMESSVNAVGALLSSGGPIFVTDASNPGPIVVERGQTNGGDGPAFVHASAGTLAVRNITRGTTDASGPGAVLFVEDVVGGPHALGAGATAYYRQLNPENTGTKLVNAGGDAWILGIKTEKEGTVIETTGGGRTELIGGLVYPVQTLPIEQPMFVAVESDFSAIVGESSFSASSNHEVVVEQTRGGELRRLFDSEVPARVGFGRGVKMSLYSGVDAGLPAPGGPSARYPLDETAGAVLPESTGSAAASDGSASGGPAWEPGIIGNALRFDGVDDGATLEPGVVSTQAGAVSLWINTTQTPADAAQVFYFSEGSTGNGGGSENEAHVALDADGSLGFFLNGSSQNLSLAASGPWNGGVWRHVVASWDRDGFADLYVDGERRDSAAGGVWNLFDTSAGFVRLARPNAATRFYEGLVDDVRIYGRPIGHDEVYDLFNAGRGFANYPPAIDAGRDQVIQDATYARSLEGQAVDDGQPAGSFTVGWTVESGPLGPGAGVSFSDASDPTATATFAQAGVYTLRLTGDDTVAVASDEVVASVFDPLPAPWENTDEGSVGQIGWAVFAAPAAFELNGSGTRIGGNSAQGGDSFHFVHQPINGNDREMRARIDSVGNTSPEARAGVMFRQDFGSTRANAFLGLTADGRIVYTARAGSGGGTGQTVLAENVAPPVWVRLTRPSTNRVRASWSADGSNWTVVGERTVNVGGGPKLIGLAACASDNNALVTAEFAEVFFGPADPLCVPDFEAPTGVIDGADVGRFLADLAAGEPSTGHAEPHLTNDFFDAAAYQNLLSGCAGP